MSTKKVKVLHLLSSNRFSGAENVVFQIMHLFKDDKFDMVYSSLDGQIRESLDTEKIRFYPISKVNIKEVSKVVKEFRPDIIHAHDVKASVIASFFCKHIQVISHMHVNHEKMGRVNLKTLLYFAISNRFKHIFWVSNSAFDKYIFKKWIIDKSSVLYNVIDSEKIRAKSQVDVNHYNYDVVYLGRLSYQKNPERLINVLIKAIRIKKDLNIAIIGTGELEKKAKEIVEYHGVRENISFLGFQSNPLKILHDAKVMLMTSRFEGTPMCALESMALGVPIVSTPVDGLVDVIQDGVTGFLSEDDDILAEKVVEISTNNKIFQQLSKQSLKSFAKINDLTAYHERIYNIYVSEQ